MCDQGNKHETSFIDDEELKEILDAELPEEPDVPCPICGAKMDFMPKHSLLDEEPNEFKMDYYECSRAKVGCEGLRMAFGNKEQFYRHDFYASDGPFCPRCEATMYKDTTCWGQEIYRCDNFKENGCPGMRSIVDESEITQNDLIDEFDLGLSD